jgi:hypothetical protein
MPTIENKIIQRIPVMEEEMIQRNPIIEEEMRRRVPIMEEETYQKYVSVNEEPKELSRLNNIPVSTKKIKRSIMNSNSKTRNPININITHDNNMPYTINNKINDINNYRFDDGLNTRSTNSEIDKINQNYFSDYLENDINNNYEEANNNYQINMMKLFLNGKKNSSPFILDNQWAEWNPVD